MCVCLCLYAALELLNPFVKCVHLAKIFFSHHGQHRKQAPLPPLPPTKWLPRIRQPFLSLCVNHSNSIIFVGLITCFAQSAKEKFHHSWSLSLVESSAMYSIRKMLHVVPHGKCWCGVDDRIYRESFYIVIRNQLQISWLILFAGEIGAHVAHFPLAMLNCYWGLVWHTFTKVSHIYNQHTHASLYQRRKWHTIWINAYEMMPDASLHPLWADTYYLLHDACVCTLQILIHGKFVLDVTSVNLPCILSPFNHPDPLYMAMWFLCVMPKHSDKWKHHSSQMSWKSIQMQVSSACCMHRYSIAT